MILFVIFIIHLGTVFKFYTFGNQPLDNNVVNYNNRYILRNIKLVIIIVEVTFNII